MSELLYIQAPVMVVNDLHRHVINLARVASDRALGPQLYRRLRREVFHPDALARAQSACRDTWTDRTPTDPGGMLDWAADYFVAAWMGRSAVAGTRGEFKGGLSIRWTTSGGDSNVRYRSAVESLCDWRKILTRCNFVCEDVFTFLDKVKDQVGAGLYLDPPFPGPGDGYTHSFTEAQHRQLSERLERFASVRIVCRFYDHPLVREIYNADRWRWRHIEGGRKQSNADAPEVLICRGQ